MQQCPCETRSILIERQSSDDLHTLLYRLIKKQCSVITVYHNVAVSAKSVVGDVYYEDWRGLF